MLRDFGDPLDGVPRHGLFNATIEAKFFFQFVFCAVSLAIVWGTTLERIKFGVYIIYSIVFARLIYPIGAHWVFGGGFLQAGDWLGTGIVGMQDFAGSTAVHLIGATGALAALLLLGPSKGKYGADGKPRAIPGHNMPLFGLGVMILWLGWFGFNPGSTLGALDGRFPEILIVTNIAAACGVLGALLMCYVKQKTLDIGMAGNGAIGALVAITAPSGYVELWAALPIGFIAGLIVPPGCYGSTRGSTIRWARSPRTACAASGARWPAACSPRRGSRSTTRSAIPTAACSTPVARPADRAGGRLRRRLHLRLRDELRDLLGHQEDLRPARHRRGRGRRPGHLRARHVRLPGGVHPGARAHRLRRRPDGHRPARARHRAAKKEMPA